ncbi:hypothetical protein MPER_13330, partial [Moniliophthora perniciosa FA553]
MALPINRLANITNGLNESGWISPVKETETPSFMLAWNVLDDELLRYKYLNEFDIAMNHAEAKYGWLEAPA